MSVVTTVALIVAGMTDAELRGHLATGYEQEHGPKVWFDVDLANKHQEVSGHKAAQAEVYIGAFNYCDDEQLVAWLRGLPWGFGADNVVAVIVSEHDDMDIVPIYGNPTVRAFANKESPHP